VCVAGAYFVACYFFPLIDSGSAAAFCGGGMWERSHQNIGRRTPAIFIFDLSPSVCMCVFVKKVVLYLYCIYHVCTYMLEERERYKKTEISGGTEVIADCK